MPVVIDDTIPPVRPAVYPPAPPGTPPSAGGGAAPPATWVPGTAGTAGTAGYTPDYIALVKSSPEYQMWAASAQKRNLSYGEIRAMAIRELVRQYGGIPPAWQDAFRDVRPEDIAAAQQNQFSQTANIQRSYDRNVNAMRRALAARGMLQTGELTFGQGEQDLARGEQEQDALTNFLKGVGGAVGTYTGDVAQVAGEESGVVAGALPTIREMYPTVPGKPGTPGTPGHWTTPPAKPPARTAIPATHPTKAALQPRMMTKAQWLQGPKKSGTYRAYVNWWNRR